ncbi:MULTISPECIES: hypothetical protein [unclassified Rhizobium]|uniref:hypothetical protein n=1 Tax=unclassified Rhizobium TaxID=2613769 RepID=UPI00177E86A3|nr:MULTISPECIES: hypothetical protein [unclassified Rhizobium]MBD8688769.1 hypothetical protein [Rhizobium sp. CFBP 13644]MBD8694341.1 hypothetical protein [Rhizobium sp. CFBP 13717]
MIGQWGFAKQYTVRMICALALLFVGFAHKPPVIASIPIPQSELAQYVLPDGTFAVLCLPSEDGKAKHDNHDAGSGCEACRLTASITLPDPADTFGQPILREIQDLVPVREEATYRQLFPPNTSPRGPPSGRIA